MRQVAERKFFRIYFFGDFPSSDYRNPLTHTAHFLKGAFRFLSGVFRHLSRSPLPSPPFHASPFRTNFAGQHPHAIFLSTCHPTLNARHLTVADPPIPKHTASPCPSTLARSLFRQSFLFRIWTISRIPTTANSIIQSRLIRIFPAPSSKSHHATISNLSYPKVRPGKIPQHRSPQAPLRIPPTSLRPAISNLSVTVFRPGHTSDTSPPPKISAPRHSAGKIAPFPSPATKPPATSVRGRDAPLPK